MNLHRPFRILLSRQQLALRAGPRSSVRFSNAGDASHPCWNCAHKNTVFCLFCERCRRVQDPVEAVDGGKLDYFQVLGLPQRFDLSKQALSASFRALQAKLHPDKFATASEKEQVVSSDSSSLVNRAYSVLKDPHARGLHLLELNGLSLEDGDGDVAAVDGEFLMWVMEINEDLVSGQSSAARLEEIYEENEARIAGHAELLAKAFREGNLKEARRILAEMKYFDNIAEKLANAGIGVPK